MDAFHIICAQTTKQFGQCVAIVHYQHIPSNMVYSYAIPPDDRAYITFHRDMIAHKFCEILSMNILYKGTNIFHHR